MLSNLNPLITTAIVTYNCGEIVKGAIDSILNQSYKNTEIVIVDGKSDNLTQEVLSGYKQKIQIMISEPDKGVYDAMNKALKLAHGDFLIFLGADDHFISNNVLENVVRFMKNPNMVYYGNVYRNTRNDIYKGRFVKYKLACENICHQSIFYPKTIYKKNEYDLNFPVLADYVYNIRLWNKVKFSYMPICISYYNCLGLSAQKNKAERFSKMLYAEIKEHLGYSSFLVRHIYLFIKSFK